MRIPAITNNYCNTPYTYKNKKQPSFSGIEYGGKTYYGLAADLADKYRYAKNYNDLIWEEVEDYYDALEYYHEAVSHVRKFRADADLKDAQIADLKRNLQRTNKNIESERQKQIELARLIDAENDKRDIQRVKIKKILINEEKKRYVQEELKYKYIELGKLEKKKYPDGIMILGLDDKDSQKDIITYLRNNNCNVLHINFNTIPLKNANKELLYFLNKIKNSEEHSILYIENFDKYTIPTDENFNFIDKIKSKFDSCSEKENTTILIFESNPDRLEYALVQGHRFQRIDASNIKGEDFLAFVPKHDGYTMHYGGSDDETVDLYLASFGHTRDRLWIDTSSTEKIKKVFQNIDKIKAKELFKYVMYAEMPEPDDEKFTSKLIPLYRKTLDYKDIYGIELTPQILKDLCS